MDGVEVVGLETACEALKHCLQRAPPVTYRHPQLSIYCEVYTYCCRCVDYYLSVARATAAPKHSTTNRVNIDTRHIDIYVEVC